MFTRMKNFFISAIRWVKSFFVSEDKVKQQEPTVTKETTEESPPLTTETVVEETTEDKPEMTETQIENFELIKAFSAISVEVRKDIVRLSGKSGTRKLENSKSSMYCLYRALRDANQQLSETNRTIRQCQAIIKPIMDRKNWASLNRQIGRDKTTELRNSVTAILALTPGS